MTGLLRMTHACGIESTHPQVVEAGWSTVYPSFASRLKASNVAPAM